MEEAMKKKEGRYKGHYWYWYPDFGVYGDNIGGWASKKPDGDFVYGV